MTSCKDTHTRKLPFKELVFMNGELLNNETGEPVELVKVLNAAFPDGTVFKLDAVSKTEEEIDIQ